MTQKQQFKMNFPADVFMWVTAEAESNCRSKSAQIIFALRSVMAAGGKLGGEAPAAENNEAVLTHGTSINTGNGDARDDYPHR